MANYPSGNSTIFQSLFDLIALAGQHVRKHRFGVREAELIATASNNYTKYTKVVYDFAVLGGALGTYVLPPAPPPSGGTPSTAPLLPAGAIITSVTQIINTAPTSTGSTGTITLNTTSAGALNAAITANGAATSLNTNGTPLPKTQAAAGALQVTIATNPVLSGKVTFLVGYI